MNHSIKFLALLVLVLSSIGCNKDPEFQPALFTDSEIILIETDIISARYQENEEAVKLIVEDLLNTSDDRESEFPVIDFLSIDVDVNNNNLPDNSLDKSYTKSSGGDNCMQFILNGGNASTVCIQEEGYTYSIDFRSSSKSENEHIIYEFIIRKDNVFASSDTVGLVFMMRGSDSGGAIPSTIFPMFVETIEFSL